MSTTTRSFGNVCIACVVAGVVLVSAISLAVVIWMSLIE